MSRWLQAARACESRSGSILTKDTTDTTDKTPCNGAAVEVLSVSESRDADETTCNYAPENKAVEVLSVSSALSVDAKARNQGGEVPSVPSPSRPDYPPGAIIHLARYRPKLDRDGKPIRTLPTDPATCAICGLADWHVGMTDRQGRTLHVMCWKAEGGTA